jgi:hypothetical protein
MAETVKSFTIIKPVENFKPLGEAAGVHDVALVGVQRVTGIVDGQEVGHIVWHRKISSVLTTIGGMNILNPLFERRIRRAEIKAGQKAAAMNFLNGGRE